MSELLFVLWLFWPAGVAIMMPVIAAHSPGLRHWNTPMDGGGTFRGKRVLGDNKTWRGFITGTAAGVAWFGVQILWYEHSAFIRSFSPLDYSQAYSVLVGVALSAGALIGDAVGSFLKRQVGVAPGKSWFPFDQIDFIAGGLIASLVFVRLPWWVYVLSVPVWIVVHLLFGIIGYLCKFSDSVI